MRFRLCSPEKLWNFKHWAERAALLAFVVPGLLVAAVSIAWWSRPLLPPPLVWVVVAGGGMGALIVSDCYHVRYWWVATLWGSFVGIIAYISAVLLGVHVAYPGHSANRVVDTVVWMVAFAGVYTLVWRALQTICGPIVVQDGTLCATCAYCLIGNTTGTCPECGTPRGAESANSPEGGDTGT